MCVYAAPYAAAPYVRAGAPAYGAGAAAYVRAGAPPYGPGATTTDGGAAGIRESERRTGPRRDDDGRVQGGVRDEASRHAERVGGHGRHAAGPP